MCANGSVVVSDGGKGLTRRRAPDHFWRVDMKAPLSFLTFVLFYMILSCQKSQNGAPEPNFTFCKNEIIKMN